MRRPAIKTGGKALYYVEDGDSSGMEYGSIWKLKRALAAWEAKEGIVCEGFRANMSRHINADKAKKNALEIFDEQRAKSLNRKR